MTGKLEYSSMNMTIFRYAEIHQCCLLSCKLITDAPGLWQGILFHDRMNQEELDKCRPELVYMEKVFQQYHPGVAFQSVQ